MMFSLESSGILEGNGRFPHYACPFTPWKNKVKLNVVIIKNMELRLYDLLEDLYSIL